MNEQMEKAIKEYNEKQSVSALEIANKYGVAVKDLHEAYARFRASL